MLASNASITTVEPDAATVGTNLLDPDLAVQPPYQVTPTLGGYGIEVPNPMQGQVELDDLPPFPEADKWPDGGQCVVVKPGAPVMVKAVRRAGALVTTCRHYRAFLPPNSRRWAFSLLYAAGVEIYDPTVKQITEVPAEVAALATVTQE